MYLLASVILNLVLLVDLYYFVGDNGKLSWSSRAAEEAEAVAALTCSGHGRALLDGSVVDGVPVCECNTCFSGSDCSVFSPECPANVDSGDPLFLEPFWRNHAASSAVVLSGWHRMDYTYSDHTFSSREVEKLIRRVHATVGNAIADDKFIVFGAGSTQLLNAAVYAFSNNTSAPSKVVVSIPYYPIYRMQTEFFNSSEFVFEGDTSMWTNRSTDASTKFIEFVTSPNNPDGKLKEPILQSPTAKTIYDHAYYWPHFTAIPAPANGDLMIFTISKLTGHASTRFGWALVKDASVYEKMTFYMQLNTMGASRDSQLRALKLLKVVLEGDGKEIFQFGYQTMRDRWKKLNEVISESRRLSIQEIPPQYCNFFKQIREPSPAYAWLKCEREEDKSCYEVLKAYGNIISRGGENFSAEDRYTRLSLIKSQDDYDLLLQRIIMLVSKEEENGGARIM